MKKNIIPYILIITATAIIVAVSIYIVSIKKAIPGTTVVSEAIDYDIKKTKSEVFYAACNIGYNRFYVPYGYDKAETENGYIIPYSENEWFAYTLGDEEDDVESLKKIIVDLSREDIIKTKITIEKKGFIGITPGGYEAGKIYTLNNTYYALAYYIEDRSMTIYITTDKSKLSSGYELITENIKTMLYSDSVLEGTDDMGDEGVTIPDSDPYATEILEGAKYSNMVVGKDFKKMRVIFSCSHPENINEIYMRRQIDRSIIYPSKDEEHDEGDIVFIVDNVSDHEEFQFVVYTDSDIGEIKAYTVEYEESKAVNSIKE